MNPCRFGDRLSFFFVCVYVQMLVLLRSLHTILTSALDCIVLLQMLCVCVSVLYWLILLLSLPVFLCPHFFCPKKKSKREDNRI